MEPPTPAWYSVQQGVPPTPQGTACPTSPQGMFLVSWGPRRGRGAFLSPQMGPVVPCWVLLPSRRVGGLVQ